MKATFDIPDDLYRRVKARTALEGRPLRAVAVQLFQEWLNGPDSSPVTPTPAALPDDPAAPWLAITRRYVQPGINHDLAAMREAIAAGWGAQAAGKLSADGQ